MKKIFILFVVFIFISCDLILLTTEGYSPYTIANYTEGIVIRCEDGFLINDIITFEYTINESATVMNVLNRNITIELYDGDWHTMVIVANGSMLIEVQ